MSDSHVFVITSLKDLTSTVALEALSLGLPIISLDHCGFADLVNDKCGIKLKIESAHQIEYDLSRSLLALYSNEEFRKVLAQGAFERSKSYSWRLKMNTLDRLYDSVTHSSAASNNTIELDC
jgi:glycosyltransferase involved in cell wall biosynthesis